MALGLMDFIKKGIVITCFLLLPSWVGAATYYVKTGGSDSADGLSDANAWASIAKVQSTVTSGDIVYFRSQDTWTNGSGDEVLTASAGVTYNGTGYGTGTRATLRATGTLGEAVVTIYVSNVTFQGFNIDGNSLNHSGIAVNYPSPSGNISNITINNCVVHDIGASNTYVYGIAIEPIGGRSVTNVSITNCTVYNTVHEGITLYPSWQQTGNYIDTALIRGCEIYNTGTQGVDFGNGILIKDDVRNATIEFNYLHDNFVGIQYELYSAAVGKPNNIINRYNIIKDNTSAGIHFYITSGVAYGVIDIYGNLLIDNGRTGKTYGAGIIWYGGNYQGSTFNVYNNTIYSITNTATNKYGVMTGTLSGTFTLNFRNNLIYTDDHTCLRHSSNNFVHSDNLYFRTSGNSDEHANINGSSYNRATVKSTYETSAENTDPMFKNSSNLPTGFSGTYGTDMVPNADGLSILSGSNALNKGITLASPYNSAINLAGGNSGLLRPQETGFDIGAYEYVVQLDPVLFFSDLTWGPKTGWEGSTTKGAAVTVWGKNFGATRGTSYITVGGVNLTSASDYAEWGVTGTANHVARGMERITFWLKSTMASGATTISISVGSLTSNTLAFNITTGSIYFISVTDGSNSYNGLYSTRAGHTGSDGPFRDIWKFNPCGPTDPAHTTGSCNPSQDGQYIVYVRAGTYTALDVDDAFIALRGPYGGATKQKALIGYPAEAPLLNTSAAGRGIVWNADYSPYGRNSYFTFAKLYNTGGTAPYGNYGDWNRVIGNHIKDCLDSEWSGLVWVGNSQNIAIYGNYFDYNGFDSYKHNIYVKSQAMSVNVPSQYVWIGWNEFSSPYSNDDHGGAIFLSKEGGFPYNTNHIYIHDNYFHDGSQSDFIYADDGARVDYVWIWNNIFTGGTGSDSALFLTFGNLNNYYIYNNTFYDVSATDQYSNGVVAIVNDATKANINFSNNIFVASRTGQQFFYLDSFTQGISTIRSSYDLFYSPSGQPIGSLGGGITNYVNANPLFVNAAARDFSLQSTSPARGAGTSSLTNDAGSDIPVATRDYNGLLRGGNYDIGAIQYSTTTPPAPPAAPSITYPANGATGIALTHTETWTASAGATSYRLQVSTVSNFVTTVFDQSGIGGTSQEVTGLSYYTVYYVRANATNAGGTSAWSTVISFTTLAAISAPAGLRLSIQ